MTDTVLKPGWLCRMNAKLQSLVGYRGFKRDCLRAAPPPADAFSPQVEEELNRVMAGYPRNHEYRIIQKRIVPSFRLYERLRLVMQTYPQPLESFLDIGCCRGFYVLDAALRRHCPRAVGIDVHQPFVATAQRAAKYLAVPNVCFHFASLEDVSREPQRFGGPFQTVMLIGTYHYLFWGSSYCPTAYHSHDEILRRLASICTDRLIFSARITMDRLPKAVREKLTGTATEVPYTPEALLQSAERYFHVQHAGYLGKYALLVMTKRGS
jgi:SAM-dependent methyltransferase